jgi:hypothetical protein
MMAILTVAIENTVKIDVAVVKLFNYEKIVLVDPIRVARLEALNGGDRRVSVLLSVHGQRLTRN